MKKLLFKILFAIANVVIGFVNKSAKKMLLKSDTEMKEKYIAKGKVENTPQAIYDFFKKAVDESYSLEESFFKIEKYADEAVNWGLKNANKTLTLTKEMHNLVNQLREKWLRIQREAAKDLV